MSPEEFKNLYLCTFEPDERTVALEEQLEIYYEYTEHCSAKTAMGMWHSFRCWADERVFSAEEINFAKGRVQERLGK